MMCEKEVGIVELQLVREKTVLYRNKSGTPCIEHPEDIVEMMKPLIASLDKEQVFVLCMDAHSQPVAVSRISIGTSNNAICNPAEIMKTALMTNSIHIALIHSHPSGNPVPSNEDKQITERVKKAGELMGIELEDHIIIGDNGDGELRFYSFFREGRMED